MTDKQRKYIETICKFLEIEFPKITTKEEAQEWLSVMVPKYQEEMQEYFYIENIDLC